MKKDAKTFHQVAERCTRFASTDCDGTNATNSTTSCEVSCKHCKHYEPSKVCTLDLYREIVKNHNL